MMAAAQGWTLAFWLALLLVLLNPSTQFELDEDAWEGLGEDVASLHRLKGLASHFTHFNTTVQTNCPAPRFKTGTGLDTGDSDVITGTRMILTFEDCDDLAVCVQQKKKDVNGFLRTIEGQKIHDVLLSASETSYTYRNKVILIMDRNVKTLQLAKAEYSEDPDFSTKAEINCLYSKTCPSDISKGTVIKLFGTFSKDQNTFSGLSGSSLASLILRSEFRQAFLFSTNSNTSTTFRNQFLEAFRTHDKSVVWETASQNNHIYQAMDSVGTSLETQAPKRPVDHSTQYDSQHIVILQDDLNVRDAATFLFEKHPTVSSVYMLENMRPKLIKGHSTTLTAESRLVLVGHGTKGRDGKMRLGGHKAEEIAEIISHMSIERDQIKTTSVVGCNVGSDEDFIKTLLKELHTKSIDTELHLKNSLVQVTRSGKKITGELTPNGKQILWKTKAGSKSVVGKLSRNFEVVIQTQSGDTGQDVYPDETDFLGESDWKISDNLPSEPGRFVDQNFRKPHTDEIEALAWAVFRTQKDKQSNSLDQLLRKVQISNNNDFVIYDVEFVKNGETVEKCIYKEIHEKEDQLNFLNKCYEIQSGEDILKIITHLATVGEELPMHFMLNDWIYKVDQDRLYVYPAGKRIMRNRETYEDAKNSITQQIEKEKYRDMKEAINKNPAYSEYAVQTLKGTYKRPSTIDPSTEAWFSTFFMASVISESTRNFRSFPVTLMALEMSQNPDNNIAEQGRNMLFDDLPMVRGGSWPNPEKRGFYGTSSPKRTNNLIKNSEKKKFDTILEKENTICSEWLKSFHQTIVNNEGLQRLYRLVHVDQNTEVVEAYKDFETKVNNQKPPSTSGVLGGSPDGPVLKQDLYSATEVEHSLKLSSYYSSSSAKLAGHLQDELLKTFGEKLEELSVKPNSAIVKDEEFHCQLVSIKDPQETVDWKVQLPAESQYQMEKILKNMDKVSSGSDMKPGPLERVGIAVGMAGLILGAQGAVHAFEQGDITQGTVATLQTVHGVTAMSLAALGKRVSVSAEGKVIKAVSTILKSPVSKRALIVVPIIGLSFGVYNIAEDIQRGDTLGYIDAGLDTLTVTLDVVELAQPELAPVIVPINLALSTVRMLFDDIYLDVQEELNNLPPDAGVLDKIGACFLGMGKGIVHFMCDIASFFYTIPYREIENGRTLVNRISDYHKYYLNREVQAGRKAIDFTGGESSWNGGGISFSLSEQGPSEMCMDYFVSDDASTKKMCWSVETTQTDDIVLGTGESHELQYSEIKQYVLLFIPAGSISVVSGYQELSYSRYGNYSGNSRRNNFFAVQKNPDSHEMEIMLSYYYKLIGKAGDDTFYLGPQRSYVEGQGGRDTYIIPKDGGNTNINNSDPFKTTDLLILGVNYDQISVSKSGDDVIIQYLSNHYVRVLNWFVGEEYQHMNLMSADGIMFDISTAKVIPLKLTARAVNLMSNSQGQIVNTTQPHLLAVTYVLGSNYNDQIIGNARENMLDGGGGQDYIKGGEGEDVYIIKERKSTKVKIDNYSTDKALDMIIIEAELHTFKTKVSGNNLILKPFLDQFAEVTLINWFLSEENRHLLVTTKDLITFSLSEEKYHCSQSNPLDSKCIISHIIDYSESSKPLVVDLQDDNAAYQNVTEIRGSPLNDIIRCNSQANTIISGPGSDFLEGRGGQDLYVVTPGQGTKIISNDSPDLALDTLLLKEAYKRIEPQCFGQDMKLLVDNKEEIQLNSWFKSEMSRHLQIRSNDGIMFLLSSNSSQCGGRLKLPQSVDYRNVNTSQVMEMNTSEFLSVVEMYGSTGLDIMTGNDKDNWLDPFTGGGRMTGGEGQDTYIVKQNYGTLVEIDNFALDQKEDTVQFEAKFFGSNFSVYSENHDVIISAHEKGQNMRVRLKNYRRGYQFQHLNFQTADGVHFWVMSPVTNQSEVLEEPWIKTHKLMMEGQGSDCHIDLESQGNLLTIHTVQGCPHESNHIHASDIDNAVFGGLMDDVLDGDGGDDTLVGGQGNDVLLGSAGNDTLYGLEGNDTLLGGPGWDSFVPGPGEDVMDGGSGRDTVLYEGDHKMGTGVYVNLLSGEGHLSDAEGDMLKDVENVIGTIYPDILVSGFEPALLKGSDGGDILVSVNEGDTLIGGDGRDVYMMVSHHGWITIDNCAEDDATDVLYLPFVSLHNAECNQTSLELSLKFQTDDDTFVGIYLLNWVNSTHGCGHLTVILREGIMSVETIQQNCKILLETPADG